MEKQYVDKKVKVPTQDAKSIASKTGPKKAEKKEEPKSPSVTPAVNPTATPAAVPAPAAATEEKKEAATTPAPSATEPKADAAKEQKKTDKKDAAPKVKKDEAIANGLNFHASKKHCMYICEFIKNKSIDQAIKDLGEVILLKRPIKMRGEIPHRSFPGMMSGRYPVNASKQFIYLLKALKGNVQANNMDVSTARITFASANWASRPSKRGGGRFKRTHVLLKATEVVTKAKGAVTK